MKNKIVILILLTFIASPVFGASKLLSKAMKAYERHDYLLASNVLLSNINSFSSSEKEAAMLYLGIINNKNAAFYKSLFLSSIKANKEYLSDLVKVKGKNKSKYATLYLAETYLNEQDYAKALKLFKSFLKTKGITKEDINIANIQTGLSYALSGKLPQAKQQWKKINNPNGSAKLALIAAKLRSKEKVSYKAKTLYQDFLKLTNSGKEINGRDLSNILLILTEENMLSEAFDLIASRHVDSPSLKETFKDEKKISFYDISLLENSYKILHKIGSTHLLSIDQTSKYAPTAAYYLMDSGITFGNESHIASASKTLMANVKLPKSLMKLQPVKLNAGEYASGKHKMANDKRDKIILNNADDPNIFAEVLLMCVYTGADCTRLIEQAKNLSGKSQGRKYVSLNTSIGHYLIQQGQAEEALTYLELARDKSNKNKISANDPTLLVDLAEAYRLNNVYLETLEIYFEMNNSFPVVRQIQEAVQGTYATHQKSAGDVKIF
ncbi:MAG: hypothetical protein OEX19_01635 [Gammaproteobacteria bacterium]|nr:hypothetical protein [Gammaproteobacteria bacterium]